MIKVGDRVKFLSSLEFHSTFLRNDRNPTDGDMKYQSKLANKTGRVCSTADIKYNIVEVSLDSDQDQTVLVSISRFTKIARSGIVIKK